MSKNKSGYPQKKIEEIDSLLSKAVKKAKAAGLKVQPGSWGISRFDSKRTLLAVNWVADEDLCCCPNGALCLMLQPEGEDSAMAAAEALGVSDKFIEAFVEGYDGGSIPLKEDNEYKQGYDLGLKFRKKYMSE